MSVGVLVESTLPGMVGVGEVALGVESLGDGLMVGELLAVVIGGLGPGLAADESQTLRLLGTVAAKTAVGLSARSRNSVSPNSGMASL